MGCFRRRALARCRFGAAMLLSLSAVADPHAANITLRVGDRFLIRGTPFDCRVAQVRSGIEVACAYDNQRLTAVRPNSYGVAITNQFAGIVHYSTATTARLVVQRAEPKIRRKPFPVPNRRPMALTLGPGESAPIGGTYLACGNAGAGKRAGLGCFPVGPYSSSIAGAWGVFLVGNRAALVQYRGHSNVVAKKITKTQP